MSPLAKPTRPAKTHSIPSQLKPTNDLTVVAGQDDNSDKLYVPAPWIAKLVMVWVMVHFVLCAISYSSSIASSGLQDRILAAFGPYMSLTHLDADGASLHFSDSSLSEKTHLISQSSFARPETEDQWTVIGANESGSKLMGGYAGGDRQRRWQRLISGMAELGESDQGNVVAWLIEPIVLAEPKAKQIRITREPDLMTTVVDDAAPPAYTVSVLRQEGQQPRLIQVSPPRLTAPAIDRTSEGAAR